jgi:hypothetical protein
MIDELLALSEAVIDELDRSLATDGCFDFSGSILPTLPSAMSTGQLVIRKGKHDYNSYYLVDSLKLMASKTVMRSLAIVALCSLFHDDPEEVTLELTNDKSDIRKLIVRSPFYHRRGSRLTVVPYDFTYIPEETDKHPFLKILPFTSILDLPRFFLTTVDNPIYSEGERWRDTVVGFGTDLAHVLLAELLLNASAPGDGVAEYALEGEAGFRGVGPLSAEVTIVLPGSLAWEEL